MSPDPPFPKKSGRPSLDAEGHPTVPLLVRLSNAQYLRLQQIAHRHGVTAQDIVRGALEKGLDIKN